MTLPASPFDETYPWLESEIQAYIVFKLRRDPGYNRDWMFAGDMNGLADTDARRLAAHAVGLEAGEPNLRFYTPRGQTLFIELKRARDGKPSPVQRQRIKCLRRLGHKAGIIYARSPWHGYRQVARLLSGARGRFTLKWLL